MDSASAPRGQGEGQTYAVLRCWVLRLASLAIVDLLVALVLVTFHAAYPSSIPVGDLTPFVYILALASAASTVLGVVWVLLRYPKQRMVVLVILVITLGVMVAHLYTIDTPATSQCFSSSTGVQGCVMDEIYYVPAAQTLLSGAKCGPYLDNCNLEHPFLGKAFIAAGIELFGNTDFGWRFFEGLLGTLCVPILFGICFKFTKDTKLSLFAAFLLGLETLFFVQSSIAVIDIHMIFFGLLAFLVYVADLHFWKFDRYIVSGLLLGLSLLSKEIGVFLVAFLVFYNLLLGAGDRRARTISSLKMLAVTAILFCAGLQLYDTLFGNIGVSNFLADIHYILSYGASLRCTPTSCGWSINGNSQPPFITPFTWFLYYVPVSYEVVRVTVTSAVSSVTYVSVGYFATTDFFETWFTYIWVPYVIYLWYRRWKGGRATERISISPAVGAPSSGLALNTLSLSPTLFTGQGVAGTGLGEVAPKPIEASPDGVQVTLEGTPVMTPEAAEVPAFGLARFALIWLAFTYIPYVLLFFYGRVTYPYYILSADPAIAIGMAYVMSRRWFPREIAYVLLAGVFLWFFLFYPDKSFLPTWLRAMLGH